MPRLILLLSILLLISAPRAAAQATALRAGGVTYIDGDEQPTGKDPYAKLPPEYRDMIEQDELVKSKPRAPIVDKRPIPWTAPDGQQLVGIVEERYLTKPQLAARADLLLRGLPLEEGMREDDRRVLTEGKLLQDWIDISTLAVHAQRSGYAVSDAEVNKAMDELASQDATEGSPEGAAGGNAVAPEQRLRMIGFPEELLRQEVRDGLLVEKYVRDQVREIFSDAQLRQIYDKDPSRFNKPPRARVWQLFRPRVERLSEDEQKELRKLFQKYGKQMARIKDEAGFDQLVGELKAAQPAGNPSNIVLRDLDWISTRDPLPEPVLRAILDTEPRKLTPLVVSRLGIHLLYVREAEPGSIKTFEEALPEIQDSLFEKTRDGLAFKMRGQYKVYSSASGLNKWVPVQPATSPAAAAAAPATTASLGLLPDGQRVRAANEPDLAPLAAPAPPPPPAPAPPASSSAGDTGGLGNPPPVADVLIRNAQKQPRP